MSGGSKKSDTKKTETPTTQPVQTIQPGMPGQISTLADQLAAGFGQQPADIMAQLQQYYQPMSLPNYAPVTPTPTPTPAPVTPTPRPITKPKMPVWGSAGSEYDSKTGAYNPLRSGGANR